MSRIFYDYEANEIVHEEQLLIEFCEMNEEERNGRSFEQYVNDCTDKNGTLVELPEDCKNAKQLYFEKSTGFILPEKTVTVLAGELYEIDPEEIHEHFTKIKMSPIETVYEFTE